MRNEKYQKIKKALFFSLCLLAILAGLWHFLPAPAGLIASALLKAPVPPAQAPKRPALEVYMAACLAEPGKNKKELALEACQRVIESVDSSPQSGSASLQKLRSTAAVRSYKLLVGMGRTEEASEALLWAAKTRPR